MMTVVSKLTGKKRIEWPTVGLIVGGYGIWFAAGMWMYDWSPAIALIVMTLMVALHSSLQHEILHGHPTRNKYINEALVFFSPGFAYPYRRFQALHLKHHDNERLTDPYDDPESFYKTAYQYSRMPSALRMLLQINNTMIGRFLIGVALAVPAFIAQEFKRVRKGERGVVRAWLLHLVGLVPIVFLITNVFGIPLWLYLVTAAYFGLAIITIRTFAEHQWEQDPDGRSIIVEKSFLSLLFLNNNLHFVHHSQPTAAWYLLPSLYAQNRQRWIEANKGYVVRNYWQLLRNYGLRCKEPVVHPAIGAEEVSVEHQANDSEADALIPVTVKAQQA